MALKQCNGCKHLVAFSAACKGGEVLVRHINPYTGKAFWRSDSGRVFRPSPVEARSEKGKCGPDAKLYEPTIWARIFPWAFS